jgi:hypothetical protein
VTAVARMSVRDKPIPSAPFPLGQIFGFYADLLPSSAILQILGLLFNNSGEFASLINV